MLHPVRSVRHGGLVRVLCHRTLDPLTVSASNNPARKLVHGFRNPLLAVGVVDPIEKGPPFRRIGSRKTTGGSWATIVWTHSGEWVRTSSATNAPKLLP